MGAGIKMHSLYVDPDSCCHRREHSDGSDSSPGFFFISGATLPFTDVIGPWCVRGGKSLLLLCSPGVAMPPQPQTELGCGVSDKPATNHCFVSSRQCFEAWGAGGEKCDYSAKFCEGIYSSVAAGASTIAPAAPLAPILRHKQARQHGRICHNTHLYVKYIRAYQNKLARSHLLFVSVCVSHSQILPCIPAVAGKKERGKKKKRGSTITQRHRSAHDLATMQQAGRSCSRRGNSVSVCSTEKREGKIGVKERWGKCKSNIGAPWQSP